MAFSTPRHCAAALAACLAFQTFVTSAEEFRIETKIYIGEETQPVSETTTLFLDGVVYDFLAHPPRTAVFRKPSGGRPGRFILLDAQQRIRTELTTDQIGGAIDKLRVWAARQSDPLLKFAADPQFDETFEPESGQLLLASHLENYRVDTAPIDNSPALNDYRQFLDWYTRLNTLLHAGPPPEPRLRLNAALARHRVIPVEVELKRAGEKQPLRAEHDFNWRLSRDDRARIDEVRASLASYRPVSNEEFLRGGSEK